MSRISVETDRRIAEIIRDLWDDRVGFVQHIVGATPKQNQVELLEAADNHDYVAVRSGIGTGKSTSESWLILHYMCCRPECKVLCTSPSKDQLYNVLWAELNMWHKRMTPILRDLFVWTKTQFMHKDHPHWFAVARTATKDNPQALAGIHARYVMRVIDEGSAVFDEAFDAIEGDTGTEETKELLCGNPTKLSGNFYDAFHKNATYYKTIHWNSEQYLQSIGGLVPDRVVERMAAKYGNDSNMYLVRVRGEFPQRDGDSYIPFDWATEAVNREVPSQAQFGKVFGCDIARYGCFDDQTEILTNEGWKLFENLHGNENVLSLNSDVAEWGKITQLHKYSYNGMLNLYESASTNFSITDNHNLVVRSNPKSDKYLIRQFQNLPQTFVLKGGNVWAGKNTANITFTSNYAMPHGGQRIKKWVFDMRDWAEFLGWYISEGSCYQEKRKDGRLRVLITQKKPANRQRIEGLLDRMCIKYRLNGIQYEFSNNEIGRHLLKHCGRRQPQRRIPVYIKNATTVVMQAFLDSFALGDGSRNSNGVGRTYTSTSNVLIDDLQEMLVKLGVAGKKTCKHIAGEEFVVEGRKVTRRNNVFTLHECGKAADHWVSKRNIHKQRYSGFVYCVSTPHKTIAVRRNGCVMWSGNSDDSVIAIRQGDEFMPWHTLRGKSTMEVAGYIAMLANQHKPVAIFIDVIGLGSGVFDRLEELGFPVIPVNVSESPALNPQKYNRLRDELWGNMRDWLESRRGKICDNEEGDLVGQLTTPRYKVLDSTGKIRIETKDELKKRGVSSPNIADAHNMTFALPINEYRQDIEGTGYEEIDDEYHALDPVAGY